MLDDAGGRGFRVPLAALAVAAVALGFTAVVPGLKDAVWGPVVAQAEGGGGGYSAVSLAFWGILGAALGTAAFTGVLRPFATTWDRSFAVALAPFLVWGPVFHALLGAGAWQSGGVVAYAATEPLVYVTTAVLAVSALAVAHLAAPPHRRGLAASAIGWALVAALAPDAVTAGRSGNGVVAVVIVLASASVAVATWALARFAAPHAGWAEPLRAWFGAAVVGAHGLDGLSTWVVLRDPFGLGLGPFGEKNPVSDALVSVGSGVLFPVVKLALAATLVAYVWHATDRDEEKGWRGPLVLALFALGWGPGAANLALVAFTG